jgi:hypothetical protein
MNLVNLQFAAKALGTSVQSVSKAAWQLGVAKVKVKKSFTVNGKRVRQQTLVDLDAIKRGVRVS